MYRKNFAVAFFTVNLLPSRDGTNFSHFGITVTKERLSCEFRNPEKQPDPSPRNGHTL
jgi:hypothetical protein